MIDGLQQVLEHGALPDVEVLRERLDALLDGGGRQGRFCGHEAIKKAVHRLRFEIDGEPRSVIAKRLSPAAAQRNELVANRWLPVEDMAWCGPPLLATVADRDGIGAWQISEDLGNTTLAGAAADRDAVASAAETLAELHSRFAGHRLLGECRLRGGDAGMHFYRSSAADAAGALEAVEPRLFRGDREALRAELLARLRTLLSEAARRAGEIERWGGAETFLHGDLWTSNIFVLPGTGARRVRFIDWDHASIGPVSYDISTMLWRFPAGERRWILERYRAAASDRVRPDPETLNVLAETAELGRIANHVIWPALAIADDGAPDWAFEQLAEVNRWFTDLEPLLP